MTTTKRRIFIDDKLQAQFDKDGYVVVPFIDKTTIDKVRNIYEEADSGIDSGFYSTVYSKDKAYKAKVDTTLKKYCSELPKNILYNYKPLHGGFMIKTANGNSDLAVHQDWNMVDEPHFTSVNCWIPITTVTPENGPLMVMKGSHKFMEGLRGSPYISSPLDNFRELIRDNYLVCPKVNPGEAIIHDNRLVHYSPANTSGKVRIAVCLNMIPQEARPIHYYQNPNGKLEYFEIDENFFATFNIGQRPDYPVVKEINDYVAPTMTQKELEEHYYNTNPELRKKWWQKWTSFFSKKS